jgi:hypothetical protein
MAGVRELKGKLERLKQSLPAIAEQSIEAVKQDYVAAQKYQLEQGTTAEGGTFRKYQSSAYARRKNQMNPLPGLGNPDLKYTGAFYRGISATVANGKIKVQSSDSKAVELEAKYGKDKIFGLNPEEMQDFTQAKVKPEFSKQVIDHLKQ